MIVFMKRLVKYILTAMGKKAVCFVSCLRPERRVDFSHCTCVDEKPMVGKMTSMLQGCGCPLKSCLSLLILCCIHEKMLMLLLTDLKEIYRNFRCIQMHKMVEHFKYIIVIIIHSVDV